MILVFYPNILASASKIVPVSIYKKGSVITKMEVVSKRPLALHIIGQGGTLPDGTSLSFSPVGA